MIIVKASTAAPNHHWRIRVRYSRSRAWLSASTVEELMGAGASAPP
jgi:hypothetical protein